MADFDAVSALLMLSTGRNGPYSQLQPHDLTLRRDYLYSPHQQQTQPLMDTLAAQIQQQHKQSSLQSPAILNQEHTSVIEQNVNPQLFNNHITNQWSPAHNRTISPVYGIKPLIPAYYNQRCFSQSPQLSPQSQCSPDSGHSSSYIDDNNQTSLPPPALLPEYLQDPLNQNPPAVYNEFLRIERQSSYLKDIQVRKLMNESPVNTEYNARKSRIRKVYEDPIQEAKHAKNNLSSRRSRNKKKENSRFMSLHYDLDVQENCDLFEQEQWMLGLISELENSAIHEGIDIYTLKELRKICGLK